MNQVGFSPAFGGFNQFHQSANPTNSVVSGAQAPAITPHAIAVPVYPVVLMPAYMMAQPQMAAGTGVPMQGMADGNTEGAGGHVTANPTNALQSSVQSGFGAQAGLSGFGGGYAAGMPMMMSPVLMALGFPVMGFYNATAPSGGQVADAPPAAPADEQVVTPVVDEVPDIATPPVSDVPAEPDIIDVVPVTDAPSLPVLPIVDVSADEFEKYRLIEAERKSESSLSLQLTTQDGDLITLDFNQLDIQSSSQFRGKTLDGDRYKDSAFLEDTQRIVNMEVTGSLSAEEQAAIDSVLSSVIEVVQNFFNGDMEGAISKLKMMDFDTGQLAELSLNMSMTKTAEISRALHNGSDQLHNLKTRDADVAQALEFLATEQRRLVESAGSLFDSPSAAKLVKSLLPPMLSEPFAALQSELDTAADEVVVDDSTGSDEAVDPVSVEQEDEV
ncbi:MAG: hypothetical protein RIC89_02260 [Pseudomonadales bacterium]